MDVKEKRAPERFMISAGYNYRGVIIQHDGDGARLTWRGQARFFGSTQQAERFVDQQLGTVKVES